nr:hypothetical protein [Microbispora sp. GKU 823]
MSIRTTGGAPVTAATAYSPAASAPRGGQKPFPGLGQPDAALTLEQTYGQQRLQARDALGQRLLADAEVFGGTPEMQPLRGLGERTDQDEVKIHAAEHRRQPGVVGRVDALLARPRPQR